MKILIAPDSFKESLNATQVAAAIAEGIHSFMPDAEIEKLPFSDGGEGAFELFSTLKLGQLITCETQDALGRTLSAPYFGFNDGKTAWVELSQTAGLALLRAEEQNPLKSSTYGTGLQLKHALDNGYTALTLGIGGSATNDLGMGIFTALGGKMLNENQNILLPGGASLLQCHKLDFQDLHPKIKDAELTVACDVTNPLLGNTGAAHMYAPQKGATPEDIQELEKGALHLAEIIKQKTGRDITKIPGGGAAGGTAAGMYGIFNSTLKPGFELLSSLAGLEEKIKWADVIVTGEGKTDQQSAYGKVPFKIAQLAKKNHKPLLLFSGSISASPKMIQHAGITAAYAIKTPSMSLEYAKPMRMLY